MNKKTLVSIVLTLLSAQTIQASIVSYTIFTKGTQTIYVFGDVHNYQNKHIDTTFLEFLTEISRRHASATLVAEFVPEQVAHIKRVDTFSRQLLQYAHAHNYRIGSVAIQALDRRGAVGYELMSFKSRIDSLGGLHIFDANTFNARTLYENPQFTIEHLLAEIDHLITDLTTTQRTHAPSSAEYIRIEVIKRIITRDRTSVTTFLNGIAPRTRVLDAISAIIAAQRTCIPTANFINQTLYHLLQAMIENGFVHRIVSDITPHHNLMLYVGNNHALYLHATLPLLGYTCTHHENTATADITSIVTGTLDAHTIIANCLAALQ